MTHYNTIQTQTIIHPLSIPYPHSDPSTIIVPKLVLLWAVMTHTKMKRVRAISCMGMCPGMLITESLWS